jgi:hypothetical protein
MPTGHGQAAVGLVVSARSGCPFRGINRASMLGLIKGRTMRERPIATAGTPPPSVPPSSTVHAWVAPLARWGYAASGMVYLIVGFLALLAALRAGGRPTDAQGAFETILAQPWGRLLLAAVAFGLVGYALWRLVQAFWDADRQGQGASGLLKRVGYVGSGMLYAGLAISAGQRLLGTRTRQPSDHVAQAWTARLLAYRFGPWLVGAVGCAMLAFAGVQVWRAVTARMPEPLDTHTMRPHTRTWVTTLGRMGVLARGVVFACMGGFLIEAAWHVNPREARGLGGALRALERRPFGPWVLGVVAAGLMCYGLYMLVLAWYRRVRL